MRLRTEGGLIGTYNTPQVGYTSGVWTLRDVERNIRTNTWPADTGTSDPYFKQVGALIHADGSNGDNNNTISDSSIDKIPFTGTYSVFFDGTGDYIVTASNATAFDQDVDFTWECWFNAAALPGSQDARLWSPTSVAGLGVGLNSAGKIVVDDQQTGIKITSTTTISVGTWYHVALVRNGPTTNNLTLYINGVVQTTLSYTNWQSGMSTVTIGRRTDTSTDFQGYISNMRWVRGTAIYTAAFTPPTSALTAVTNTQLLTFQSATIVDNSTNAFTLTQTGTPTVSSGNYPIALTRTGNPGQGTFSPFSRSDGNWSNYFSGNSTTKDYFTLGNPITIGSGDFCIEAWVFLTTNQASCIFCSSLRFTINSSTNVKVINNGVADIINYTTVSPSLLGRWAHIAVTRSGTSMRLFIDGALATTVSDSTNFASATSRIGAESGSLIEPFAGHISNLRIVTGAAVYTAAFTPAGPLTSITGTQLLTCQSNRFKDNGPGNTITPTNSAMVSPFSPFTPTASYVAATNGGSYNLNGTSDYARITTAQAAIGLGTGDFTIEWWAYWNSVNSLTNYGVVDFRTSGGGVSQVKPTLYLTAAGTFSFVTSSVTRISATVTIGQWYHIALVRSSGVTKLYINGIAQATTYTDTNNYGTTSQLTLGSVGDSPGAVNSFLSGYICDFRVTNSAVYSANFTPPTSPLTTSSSPTLLLSGTNGKIFDQSGNFSAATIGTGPAKLSTTQKKFGATSILFNGTSDYLALIGTNTTAANISALQFGAADFTIEGWYYSNGSASTQTLFQLAGTNTAWAAVRLDQTTSNTLQLLVSVTGAAWAINYTTPTSINNLQWNHIAIVRSGSNFYIFVNGSQVGVTQTNSSSLYQGSGYFWIGALANTTATNFFNGYMDEIRITKYARYTANFTAPIQSFLDR